MTVCRIAVRVTPRGGADRIDAIEDDADGRPLVRLRVRAAPSDGEANAAVTALIARNLGLPRSAVRITRGETARVKTLEVDGLELQEVLARLSA
ncbi:DUF167 family protein [Brevundimonas sp.]|uniref:DUF167 family protein n=1 Tax=Brevundimonas sp. TaxID=1871086 RepID=UPI0025E4AF8A|nr:DUF167 family protein [Brevundimonas sp.]